MKRFYACCVALLPAWVAANNIQVTDISLAGINTTNKTVQVRFSVGWENSWRINAGPANWDAAWIFVKFRRGGVGDWKHAYLSNAGHVAASGSIINTGLLSPGTGYHASTNPGIGAFIYRSANGNGNFVANNMQLQWNYGSNGVSNTDFVEVKVFAIEMVYVTEGAFAAGDTATDDVSIRFPLTTINTANALSNPTGNGSLGGAAGGFPTGRTTPAEFKPDFANFPNGFRAFFCMKYEITQQGYVDFLNTLTFPQQKSRVPGNLQLGTIVKRYVMTDTTIVFGRNGILAPEKGITPGVSEPLFFGCDLNGNKILNEADDGQNVACNYLNYDDVASYLWWAGLRPMTELEFEKACRGNLPMVTKEYAWGTALTVNNFSQKSNLNNPGTALETSKTPADANRVSIITTTSEQGPARVGLFATANSNRTQAGASYYGIMEMTGNVIEFYVGLAGANKSFVGTHGNGLLDVNGLNQSLDWSKTITYIARTYVSHRGQNFIDDTRARTDGGRGVRSAY
jgi:formylglycine-generating enzyme required for sulfatase activity